MRILIFSQFYPPEMEPSGFMMESFAQFLAKNKQDVGVICGYPNFPQGKFIDKKWYEFFRSKKLNGVDIHNVYVIPSNNTSNLKRILNYTSYMISSLVKGMIVTKPDVIVATSPPIFSALSALIVAKLRRVRFILDVRDIWPESAIQMGSINSRLVIKILEYVEQSLYKNADQIVVATPGMIDLIIKKKVSRSKLHYIPCGVTVSDKLMSPLKIGNPYMKHDQSKFTVLYAGLHGFAQGLETIIDVAASLIDEDRIVFYFVGDGPEKNKLRGVIKDKGVENIRLVDPVPKKDIEKYFVHAGCALVPLKNINIFKNVFPSKTFELMALGVPTIVGVNGEISKLIKSTKSGISVKAEDIDAYRTAIMSLFVDTSLRDEISLNARTLVKKSFNHKDLNQKYFEIIQKNFKKS